MNAHAHNWQPCHGWTGRYRCTECFALGYRGVVNLGANSAAMAGGNTSYGAAIITYKCTKKGCDHPATRRNPQRCSGHR